MSIFPRLAPEADRRAGPHAGALALALLVVVLAGGCAGTPPPKPAAPVPRMDSTPALTLLAYSRRLSNTTPEGRAAAVRAARQQVRQAPGAIAYAHLALALAAPRQRLYTPDEAARYAKLALAADNAPWDPDARQYLGDMQRLLAAASQTRRSDEQRIARLEQQLAAARDKIAALSNIETRLDDDGQPR